MAAVWVMALAARGAAWAGEARYTLWECGVGGAAYNERGERVFRGRTATGQPLVSLVEIGGGGRMFVLERTRMPNPPERHVWTLSGERVGRILAFGPSYFVMLGPDGRQAASAGVWEDRRPRRPGGLWTVKTNGDEDWRMVTRAGAGCAWGPDGREVAVAVDGVVTIWDLGSGRREALGRGDWPAWSPDGRRVAYVGEDGELALVVLAEGTAERPLPGKRMLGSCLAWSPDGQWLSFCEVPEKATQFDPEHRVMSYVGTYQPKSGEYRSAGAWVWGEHVRLRWAAGGVEEVMGLIERAAEGRSHGR